MSSQNKPDKWMNAWRDNNRSMNTQQREMGVWIDRTNKKMYPIDGSWNFMLGGENVRSRGAKGDEVTDDSAAISAVNTNLLATADGGGVIFFPPGTYKISGNLTIGSSTISIRFAPGAMLSIDSGITVTINGPIEAHRHQIFTGSGTVIITGNPTVFPEWWGTGNDTVKSAYDGIKAGAGDVLLGDETYTETSAITLSASTGIIGKGIVQTTVNFSGAGIFWLNVPASTKTPHVTIIGMLIKCTGTSAGFLKHMDVSQAHVTGGASSKWVVRDLQVTGNDVAGSVGMSLTQLSQGSFDNVEVGAFATQWIDDRSTQMHFFNIKVVTSSTLTNSIGMQLLLGDSPGGMANFYYSIVAILLGEGSVGIDNDSKGISFFNILFEMNAPGKTATAFLRLGANHIRSVFYSARAAESGGTLTNLIVTTNTAATGVLAEFYDWSTASGAAACSFGTTGQDGAFLFVGPDPPMVLTLEAGIVAKRVRVIGTAGPVYLQTAKAEVGRTTIQSINNTTLTTINWTTELSDTHALFDGVADNTLFTIVWPGLYHLHAKIHWDINAAGFRMARFLKNATTVIQQDDRIAGGPHSFGIHGQSVSILAHLDVDDTVSVEVWQDSGAALELHQASRFIITLVSAD